MTITIYRYHNPAYAEFLVRASIQDPYKACSLIFGTVRQTSVSSAVFMGQDKRLARHQYVCVWISYRHMSESWPRPVNLSKGNVDQLQFISRIQQRKEGKGHCVD